MTDAVSQGTLINVGDYIGPIASFGGFGIVTKGLSASVTAKTQRSVDNGITWADGTTYNSDQSNTRVSETTIAAQHRMMLVSTVAGACPTVKLSKESVVGPL